MCSPPVNLQSAIVPTRVWNILRAASVMLVLALGVPTALKADCPTRSKDTDIAVGIRSAVPFIEFDRRGVPHGLAIDLWSQVERELRVELEIGLTEFIVCPSIRDQGHALATGALDVVISPLTITAERMQQYAFSQQYLNSGLTVATRSTGAIDFKVAFGIVLDTVTQPGVVRAIIGFLFLNLIAAVLIRWALRAEGHDIEREKGPFGAAADYIIEAVSRTAGLKSVGAGSGYGFGRSAGKMLEIVMAVVGVALSAMLFAAITSAFVRAIGTAPTLSAEDVISLRVATLENSTAQDFLHYVDRQVTSLRERPLCATSAMATAEDTCILTPTWKDAVALLASGDVDVVLGDWVALSYLARSEPYSGRLVVQGQTYVGEAYGWGVTPERTDLRAAIDRILIDEMRQPEWRRRIEKALGTGAISPY
jgi:ABC-type amino acid transport substrate-binding protein